MENQVDDDISGRKISILNCYEVDMENRELKTGPCKDFPTFLTTTLERTVHVWTFMFHQLLSTPLGTGHLLSSTTYL